MTYTERWAGPGGSDGNDGSSYALRKLTMQGLENVLSAATRYTCHIAPGTYRETLTPAVSGPAPYTTGTVSVTNGSKIVTGSSTSWLTNAEPNDWFQVQVLASGTDGVTVAGTATTNVFNSAAGNFQAGHVGMTIRINTVGAYIIAAVNSATQITCRLPDSASFTWTDLTGLTYNVGPESPYKVASVDSNTQITLEENWSAPSFTGLAYKVWGHIEYIGDYSGAVTDGVGGIVRVTGSNNDQTPTRNNIITATSINQRTFSGFLLDMNNNGQRMFSSVDGSNWNVDRCVLDINTNSVGIGFDGTGVGNTVDRCFMWGSPSSSHVGFTHTATVDNSGQLIQRSTFIGGTRNVGFTRVGGVTVRNCAMAGRPTSSIIIQTALTVGQSETVHNCILTQCSSALSATVSGEVTENSNSLWGNTTDRTNVRVGNNSNAYPPLFDSRWFFDLVLGRGQTLSPFDLASYSQLVNLPGINPPATDMRGTGTVGAQREWGPLECDPGLEISAGHGGVFSRLRLHL